MIKTVIEKIIINSFGQFIKGIERDKLSVDLFGGNFMLQNISLNHEYFDSLNTPFKLAYSSIGKLNLTASLSKLSSVPVECVLDNIYVIFEFRPEVSKETKEEVYENQKKSMKKYVEEIFKNYMKKVSEEKKEDGMMAKLGKKIIDNLQMKIINVHVRFQENRQVKYGWGLTLQQISLITANDKWQLAFINRQKQQSSTQKLFKKMNVKNLSFYWQTPKTQLEAKQIIFKNYTYEQAKKTAMREMILKNPNSIISITSEFKLIINDPQDQKIPLYELDVSLMPIKFELDRVQVIQMIDFIQKNIVQNQMILRAVKQKKKDKTLPPNQIHKIKDDFIEYVDFIILSQQNLKKTTDLEIYETQKKHSLTQVFASLQMEELMEIAVIPVKKIIKKIREEELKKKKRGWFGSADTQLDQNQIKELEKFVQSSFQQKQIQKRSESALFLSINSDISGGNFKFIDRKSNPEQNETIEFEIGQINFCISKSSDQSFMEMSFSVEQIALGLILPQMLEHKYVQNKQQILRNETRINSSTHIMQPAHEKFISVVYKKQSFAAEGQNLNPKITTTFFVQMQRVIFIYKKLYFKKFKQFFTFKNFNEYMKSTTMEKFEHLKEKEKPAVMEEKDQLAKIDNTFLIRVNAIAPKIICPFNEKQCWCFSLGDLQVESQNDDDKSTYPLKINSAYLRYYNDIEKCMNSIESSKEVGSSASLNERQDGIFSVINDMNFNVIYESSPKHKISSTKIQLPEFQLNFSRVQYENLLTIQNIFTLDTDEKQTILEHLKKGRLEIQQQKIYQGFLNVKDENLGTWKPYHGILAADWIYLYENKKELKETLKISVKNCSTSVINKECSKSLSQSTYSSLESEQEFQLELVSSQEYCHLGCQTLDELQKWEEEITKKANEFKTINQLMEFYEESDQRSQSSSKHSRKRSSTDVSLKTIKKNTLQLKIAKIGFKYQDFSKTHEQNQNDSMDSMESMHSMEDHRSNKKDNKIITLMNFVVHEIFIQKVEEQSFAAFTLSFAEVKIVDEIFTYNDPKFQTFLMMKNFTLKNEKPKTKKRSSGTQKKEKLPIRNFINIEDLKINWKPDVILIALELMNKHLKKEEKYRMDDETNKTRGDHFREVQNDTKYMFGMKEYIRKAEGKRVKQKRQTLSKVSKFIKELLRVEIKISHTQAYFIHRESHLVMFRLESREIGTEYVLGEHEKFIAGSLGTLTVEEMTGYPRKKYGQEDKVEGFCFVRKKEGSGEGNGGQKEKERQKETVKEKETQKETDKKKEREKEDIEMEEKDQNKQKYQQRPIISFNYSSYEPSVLPNQQRVDSFLYVQIQPIELIYFQQIIFRLIDYSLIQIMLLINQPEMLTVNQNLMEQLRKGQDPKDNQQEDINDKPVKILFSEYVQVIKKLVNPYFMDLCFYVKQPQIILKAEKTSSHFYLVNLDSILIQNKDIKTDKRFAHCAFNQANQYIYEEEYLITCNQLQFQSVQISHDKNGKQTQKKHVFLNPLQLELVFNKLLFQDQLNLIYPELGSASSLEYDRSFITNSKMTDILVPSCSRFEYLSLNKLINFNFTFDDESDELFIHNFKLTKLLLPKPIIYTLQVDRILLHADYQTQEHHQIKLFTADITHFTYEYLRKKDLNSQMNIKLGNTNIIGFRYTLDDHHNNHHHHHNMQKHHKPLLAQEEHLINFKSPTESRYSSEILIQSKTTGQKVIQMTVKTMKVDVKSGLLQLIFEYALMEDWIFPTINKVVPEMTFFATIEDMDAVLEDNPALLNLFRLKKLPKEQFHEQSHKLIKLSTDNLRILRLCGILCYKFHRKKSFSNQYLKQMLASKQMSTDEIEKFPEQTYMNVVVNTELYHCYKNTQQKRKIMQKFTLNVNQKRYLKISNAELLSFKQAIVRTFNLDKCFFKVSVIDLLLMKDIMEIMAIERGYIEFLNRSIGRSNEAELLAVKNASDELSTLDSMNLSVTSLSFYLINSWKEVFIPIINFKVEEMNLTSNNTFKKDIVQGDFSMMLSYFNSQIFKWEPALQRVSFSFFKQTNKSENSKRFAGLESSSSVIVNVSKEMFISLRETMAAWNSQSMIFQNRLKSECQGNNEPIEFISHYIIRNQTGYGMEIICDKQVKYRLESLEQVDHVIEMEDYEEEVVKDVIIAFRLVHPVLKFKLVGNVSVNAEKEYMIRPRLVDGREMDGENKLLIKPINQNSKQVLVIGSTKKVLEYQDNFCKSTILPFDSPSEIRINQSIYGQKSANLYKTKQTKHYKFQGVNGVLTIMPKYLVFNYTPIPLKIHDKILRPNEYTGAFEKPLINGQKAKDSILRVQHNQKQGHFYIYCQAYIVDYYGLYFDFGTSDQAQLVKKLYAAEGQKNGYKYFIYILPEAEFKFKVKITQKSKEHITLKSAIGRLTFDLRKASALCSFSAFCYLNPYKNEHLKQFNRVVEITPAYVLSNRTKDLLKVGQKDSLSSMTLKPHQRCPFFWESFDKPKQIKIAASTGNQYWGYSGALQISKSCETFVLRKNTDPTQYRIFSIHVEQTNTITFVHIFEAPSKYKIANQVKGTLITVFQSCLSETEAQNEFMSPHEYVFNVKFGEEKDFGYELPIESHALTVEVELDTNLPRFKNKFAQPIMIADIESNLYVKKIPLLNEKTEQREGELILVLEFEGNVKKLKLVEEEKQSNNELDYEYSIKLMSFGISLIGMHDDFRTEIIFCLFQGVDLRLTGNEEFDGYEVIVENFRVENELKHNVCFPTIIESYKTRGANFFLQFILNRDAKNSKFIRSIGLAINRTIVTVTSQELQALQQTLNDILSIKINSEKEQEQQLIREYELFKKEEGIAVEHSYYFEEAEIQPLKLILTFKHVNNWGGRLLKTFSSMNESMISVDGKKLSHFNAPNIGVFMKSVEESYKEEIFKTILPLIGNLSILGSPVSLVQKIGSGFKDLIELPAEQFENGPLGIGRGIAKGTKSLVKNTFQGAMNTVESFTGSLGNGLTALVDDEEFEKKREKIKNERTEHVGEGLKNGAKSIFNGFSKGITGLFTQPAKGAEKDGLPGFLLGGLKGITGLVIKPVSGIIDATTKTAEGIKNTANFLSPNEREKRLQRLHKPRPFYSHCREFRMYDPQLAQLSDFLSKYGNIKGPLGWVGYFNLKSSQKKKPIILLTYEYLIFLDLKKKEIVREYRADELVEAQRQDNFKFRLMIRDRKLGFKEGHIDLETQGPNFRIINEINKLVKFYQPKFTFQ